MKFSHIKFRGERSKRIYTAESKAEAQSFAYTFGGYYYQFTPGDWYVLI